jgi:hypothetical protein
MNAGTRAGRTSGSGHSSFKAMEGTARWVTTVPVACAEAETPRETRQIRVSQSPKRRAELKLQAPRVEGFQGIGQPGDAYVFLLPCPHIVWGAEKFVRDLLRRRHPVSPPKAPSRLGGPQAVAGAT